jgi:recombination protein RecA
VEKSGSWFSYDSERIGQGRENAKAYLKEHPLMADKIERAIRQNAGLIAAQILQGTSEASGETGSGEEGGVIGFAEADADSTVAPITGGRRGRRGA